MRYTCPLTDKHQYEGQCPIRACAHYSVTSRKGCSFTLEHLTLEEVAKCKGLTVEEAERAYDKAQALVKKVLVLRQFVQWINEELPAAIEGTVPDRWPFTLPGLGITKSNIRHVLNRQNWRAFTQGRDINGLDHATLLKEENSHGKESEEE